MRQKIQQKILDLVKSNYNSIASDFNESRKKLQWPELSNLTSQVNSGDRVLDAACGGGRLLNEFVDLDLDYMGVDNSKELISCAKINFPNYNFKVDDLLYLGGVKDFYYDWVFCIAALHHIPGKDLRKKALQNLAKKLNKKGTLVLSVWRPKKNKKFLKAQRITWLKKIFFLTSLDFGDAIFEWGGETKCENNRYRYYHAFSESEIRKIINEVGLEIINFSKDDYNFFITLKNK